MGGRPCKKVQEHSRTVQELVQELVLEVQALELAFCTSRTSSSS